MEKNIQHQLRLYPKNNKHIAIISFRFPPMGGIGARRWTKFAKYLANDGYRIHVITLKYKTQETVSWQSDTKHENITIHRIDSGIPLFFLKIQKNRILRKIQFVLNKLIVKKYYYIDTAHKWGKYLIPYVLDLINKESISTIIATGGPFSQVYFASLVKTENPLVKLIIDYRDPWNSSPNLRYEKLKNENKKEKSVFMELVSMTLADEVLFATKDLLTMHKKIFKKHSHCFNTIYNGFDEDDYRHLESSKCNKSFSFIYGGTFSFGRIEAIELLICAIKDMNDEFINRNLIVNIYSDQINEMTFSVEHRDLLKSNFNFYHFIEPKQYIKEISNSFCCLSINAKIFPYAIGSKVSEYMGLSKYIFHISNGGELSNILKERKQFVAKYDIDEIKTCLSELKEIYLKRINKNNIHFEEFNIKNIVKILEKIIDK